MMDTESTRHLIVNADDFGLTPGVSQGILRAHIHGIVTSTSLMVRPPSAAQAVSLVREHPNLSVGLHLDLCEWVFARGQWNCTYQVVPLDDAGAITDEIERQLDAFRRCMDREPTHLDSHQHVHRSEPIRSIAIRVADELGIVLRGESSRVQYTGAFYGQSDKGEPYPAGITVEGLHQILRNLPPGMTELGCHPGDPVGLDSVYRDERRTECETLCDARVRHVLDEEGIQLCSFAPFSRQASPAPGGRDDLQTAGPG